MEMKKISKKQYLFNIKLSILLGLLIGVLLGMLLMFLLISFQTDNIISNVLGHINIENINFDLNETALVEGLNKTFGVQER